MVSYIFTLQQNRFESTNISSEKVKTDNKNESKYDVQIIELLEKQIDTLNKQLEKQENVMKRQ